MNSLSVDSEEYPQSLLCLQSSPTEYSQYTVEQSWPLIVFPKYIDPVSSKSLLWDWLVSVNLEYGLHSTILGLEAKQV